MHFNSEKKLQLNLTGHMRLMKNGAIKNPKRKSGTIPSLVSLQQVLERTIKLTKKSY